MGNTPNIIHHWTISAWLARVDPKAGSMRWVRHWRLSKPMFAEILDQPVAKLLEYVSVLLSAGLLTHVTVLTEDRQRPRAMTRP